MSTNTFEGLSALQYLRIDRNAVNCDCSTVDLAKSFEANRVRAHIICDAPQNLHGRNLNHINERELKCGKINESLILKL